MAKNYLDVFCVSKFLLIDGLFLRVWVSIEYILLFEPLHEKTNVLVSDLVRHKPGCTATEDG